MCGNAWNTGEHFCKSADLTGFCFTLHELIIMSGLSRWLKYFNISILTRQEACAMTGCMYDVTHNRPHVSHKWQAACTSQMTGCIYDVTNDRLHLWCHKFTSLRLNHQCYQSSSWLGTSVCSQHAIIHYRCTEVILTVWHSEWTVVCLIIHTTKISRKTQPLNQSATSLLCHISIDIVRWILTIHSNITVKCLNNASSETVWSFIMCVKYT